MYIHSNTRCFFLCFAPIKGMVKSSDKVAVIGDGRLGLLCSEVLATHVVQSSAGSVTVIGKHDEKLVCEKTWQRSPKKRTLCVASETRVFISHNVFHRHWLKILSIMLSAIPKRQHKNIWTCLMSS